MVADRLAHELHVVVKVPAAFADFQMDTQAPPLQQAEASILRFGHQMRNLPAGQHLNSPFGC
jgi:hypothetical protein